MFLSRGDHSGTHERELLIWKLAGLKPKGEWYLKSGSGAYNTLLMAEEEGAYTLVDLATYLHMKREGLIRSLTLLYEGHDEILINVYSVYYSTRCTEGEAKDLASVLVEASPSVIESLGSEEGYKPYYSPKGVNLDELWAKLAGA